jgi:hypothetical protein
MPRNARVPTVNLSDPKFKQFVELLSELVVERCGASEVSAERESELQRASTELLNSAARIILQEAQAKLK